MIDKIFFSLLYVAVTGLIFEFVIPANKCRKWIYNVRRHTGNFSIMGAGIVGIIKLWVYL